MSSKKTNPTLKPGYIWVPWTIDYQAPIISDSNFSPKMSLKSRYSSIFESRKEKIENLLNEESDNNRD